MKSVLLSINSKYCELIANGKKTVEVRKTRPKLETPFKCYIYCTKDKNTILWYNKIYRYIDDRSHNLFDKPLNGKVIGEFMCDEIINAIDIGGDEFHAKSCMNLEDWLKYTDGHKGEMWCWHISDLVIYDKTIELSEFALSRPPQSWCYVEELE